MSTNEAKPKTPSKPKPKPSANLLEELRRRDIVYLGAIGEGGFGNVFCGKEMGVVPHYLAIKQIVGQGEFMVEAEALAEYMYSHRGHTNLITVHHNWKDADGCLCYTMDLADNRNTGEQVQADDEIPGYEVYSLAALRDREGSVFTLGEIDHYVQQLLSALEQLEKLELVHRDIKPQNILFLGGNLVLGDLSLLVHKGDCVPTAGLGTWSFMSSAQRAKKFGDKCYCWEDLYQLGEVIYQLALDREKYGEYLKRLKENKKLKSLTPVQREPLSATYGGLNEREAKALDAFLKKACADDDKKQFKSVAEFRMAWQEMMDKAQYPWRKPLRCLAVSGLTLAILAAIFYFSNLAARVAGRAASRENMMENTDVTSPWQDIIWDENGKEVSVPWPRVILQGDGLYDPFGSRLDASWEITPWSFSRHAKLPKRFDKEKNRTLQLRWKGQTLPREFQIRFNVIFENPKTILNMKIKFEPLDDKNKPIKECAPIEENFYASNAGLSPSSNGLTPNEEPPQITIAVGILNDKLKVESSEASKLSDLELNPKQKVASNWRLSLSLSVSQEEDKNVGDVLLKRFYLFIPPDQTTMDE